MNAYEAKVEQLELLKVKEEEKYMPAKRVHIVSLRIQTLIRPVYMHGFQARIL